MKINRITLIKIHLILASFSLPIFLLFLGSGLLYTFDIKGSVHKTEIPVTSEHAISDDILQARQIAATALQGTDFSLPDRTPRLKHKKGHSEVRWNSMSQSFTLQFEAGTKSALFVIRQRDLLTQIMRIHRAESGTPFKLFSLIMVLALCLVLISGFYMALGSGKLGRISLIAAGWGLLVLVGILGISV